MKKVTCISEKHMPFHSIRSGNGKLEFIFLPGGGLYEIHDGELMLNLFSPSIFDKNVSNLYLRIFTANGIEYHAMLDGNAIRTKNTVISSGNFRGVSYKVIFISSSTENCWFRIVELESTEPVKADVVYMQDIGICDRSAIKRSEAYVSHYIDQSVFYHPVYGKILCSRQNLAQNNKYPLMVSGCFEGAKGFLTDGIQFYGLSYKATGQPEALLAEQWSNIKKQHEFSCHGLASETISLEPGETHYIRFFSHYVLNHPDACGQEILKKLPIPPPQFSHEKTQEFKDFSSIENIFTQSNFFKSENLNPRELNTRFGSEFENMEKENNIPLSFFIKESHVVLKEKELRCERQHGHILRDCGSIFPEENVASSTVWMNGVFNSHLTFGNTSFFKHIGVVRGAFNFIRHSGVRIFVKDNETTELLGIPSAFVIELNSCKWIYKNAKRTVVVSTFNDNSKKAFLTQIRIESGLDAEFIVSINPVMGENEFNLEFTAAFTSSQIIHIDSVSDNYGLTIAVIEGKATIKGDELLYKDRISRNMPFACIHSMGGFTFSCGIEPGDIMSSDNSKAVSDTFWNTLTGGTQIKSGNDVGIAKLNTMIPWLAHNAMIHFATPYGLEQYSGAAWGVRDVCQGPVEFFNALGHNEVTKKVLLKVFSHQYIHSGLWPQWFMFDRHYKCQQDHCHGDVMIWPLKALCEYIENTEDYTFLSEAVPYSDANHEYTVNMDPLYLHVEKIIENIRTSFIDGTYLAAYGGGDWNDSLQPLDSQAESTMTSSWTVELIYQTLNRYIELLKRMGASTVSLVNLIENIKKDFNKYLVKNDICAGFGIFKEQKVELLLHPDDRKTGIKYRLLPAIRGIISEMFTPGQAEKHYEMINRELLLPDGAHLMDIPPEYTGGVCRYFQRAESASFFGREIGTNYIHAHLRYCEAMAKLGKADDLYRGLQIANPVGLKDIVKNAGLRQSNCYFSSSDADFSDRYEARNNYQLFKEGNITANGGWRIYSSGPGIFINLILCHFIGLRAYYDKYIFDPVIPSTLAPLTCNTIIDGKKTTCIFDLKQQCHSPNRLIINDKELEKIEYQSNPYRKGGIVVSREILLAMLDKPENKIVVGN
ncbi:MAG: hypothetical protein JXR78_13055 [Victivallales bacterium]|nr:hypothetical protein [Victivallales bacterium]